MSLRKFVTINTIAVCLILSSFAGMSQIQKKDSLVVFYDTNTSLAGYKNLAGQTILTPKYDWADGFFDNLAIVCLNGKYGYINKSGNQVINCEFDEANRFYKGFTVVRRKGKWVLIDQNAEISKHLNYDEIGQRDSFYCVGNLGPNKEMGEGLYGYINYKGEEIIKPRDIFPFTFRFYNGLSYMAQYEGHAIFWSIGDSLGLFPECEKADDFDDGLAPIVKKGKVGFINTKGTLVIPAEYDYDSTQTVPVFPSFENGYADIKKNGKYGIINNKGIVIVPFKYDNLSWFGSKGIATAMINKKEGSINLKGEWIIQPIYDQLGGYYYDEDVTSAEKNGKWGFVDKTGKVVVPFIYDLVYEYNQGAPFGKKDDKWALLNKDGSPLTPFQFEEVYGNFNQGLACVKLNGKYGFISKSGKTIISYKFDKGGSFMRGILSMYKNGEKTIYNKLGERLSDSENKTEEKQIVKNTEEPKTNPVTQTEVSPPAGPLLVIEDYFTDNKNNWAAASNSHTISIGDNRMIYENKEKKDQIYAMVGIPISLKNDDDYTVEVSMQSLTPCQNQEIGTLGSILSKAPKPVFYGFAIGGKQNNITFAAGSDLDVREMRDFTRYTCKPSYFITSLVGGNSTYLQPWTKTFSVADGGNVNVLKLVKKSGKFMFYINNRLVSTKNSYSAGNDNAISIVSSAKSKISVNYVKIYKTN